MNGAQREAGELGHFFPIRTELKQAGIFLKLIHPLVHCLTSLILFDTGNCNSSVTIMVKLSINSQQMLFARTVAGLIRF